MASLHCLKTLSKARLQVGKLRHGAHKRTELPKHPFAAGEGGAVLLPSLLFPSTGSSLREQLCLFRSLHLSLQIRSLQQLKPGNIRSACWCLQSSCFCLLCGYWVLLAKGGSEKMTKKIKVTVSNLKFTSQGNLCPSRRSFSGP